MANETSALEVDRTYKIDSLKILMVHYSILLLILRNKCYFIILSIYARHTLLLSRNIMIKRNK